MNRPATNQTNTPVFAFNPLLDVDFLDSVYETDFEYAQQVFANFLNGIREELNFIQDAFQQNDLKKVRAQLHKIKPTFSLVGLSFLTTNAENLIIQCDAVGSAEEMKSSYNSLQKEINKWIPLVEEELTKLKNTNSNP